MSTSPCIDLHQTAAVVEWKWDNVICSLATPDPSNASIQLTIRLDSTRSDATYALFEILVPLKLKDIPGASAIYLRLCPSSLTSFNSSSSATLSEVSKQKFDSTALCLEFRLNTNLTILAPAAIREPIVAARPRSGRILDSLYQLSRVTSLSIYIKDALLSNNQLQSINNGVRQGHLVPFPSPDYDISRMYGGKGAKVTNFSDTSPPAYTEGESLPSPGAPTYDRKRARQNSEGECDITQIWAELRMVHKRDAIRMAAFEALQQENRDLKVDHAKLREELAILQKSQLDLEEKNRNLKADNTQLQEEFTALQTSHHSLEEEVSELRRSITDKADTEDAERIEMLDDITTLTNRVEYLDRGKDDDAFIERLLGEIATRLSGG